MRVITTLYSDSSVVCRFFKGNCKIKKKMFALYVYVMIRPCYDEVKSTDEARKKSSS